MDNMSETNQLQKNLLDYAEIVRKEANSYRNVDNYSTYLMMNKIANQLLVIAKREAVAEKAQVCSASEPYTPCNWCGGSGYDYNADGKNPIRCGSCGGSGDGVLTK